MWKVAGQAPSRALGPQWLSLALLAMGTLRVSAQEELWDARPALRREQRQSGDWRGENKFYFNDDGDNTDSSDSNEYDDAGGGWVMPGDAGGSPGNVERNTGNIYWPGWNTPWQLSQRPGNFPRYQEVRRPGQFGAAHPAWGRPAAQAQAQAQKRPKANEEAEGTERCGVTVEEQRIIHGREAPRGRFPWQAALVYERDGQRRTYCGGALIHPRFVLTAAHCLDPRVIKGHRLVEVRLGLVEQGKVDAQARSVAIEKQLAHPDYLLGYSPQRVRNQNDIALLRLAQPAPYTEFIRPVCLPNPQGNRLLSAKGIPSPLVAAGWGLTEAGILSDRLMFARVSQVEAALCSQRFNITVPNTQLCAGGNVTDTCDGDSGGPLVQANDNGRGDMVFEVVGLVSFGPRNCGTVGLPAGYTRVAAFRAWIEQTLRQEGFKIA